MDATQSNGTNGNAGSGTSALVADDDGRGFGHVPRALRELAHDTADAREAKDAAASAAAEARAEARDARLVYDGEVRRRDPHEHRRGSLPFAVIVAIVAALLDVGPAFWAAETFGDGFGVTSLVAVLLVAALAAFAWGMSYAEHQGKTGAFLIALVFAAGLVIFETGLRLYFLLVTSGNGSVQTVLEVGLLGLVTAGLIWVSYFVLLHAEPKVLYDMRTKVEALEAKASALVAYEDASNVHWKRQAAVLGYVHRGRSDHVDALERKVRGELQAAGEES